MKKYLLLFFLSLFIWGCKQKEVQKVEFLHKEYSFPAEITALCPVDSSNVMWIGFENGIIYKKEGLHLQKYKTNIKSRIYDIFQLSDSCILVGMRNEGAICFEIKNNSLTQKNRAIVPIRNISYSVYSMAKFGDSLVFGTSNCVFSKKITSFLEKNNKKNVLLNKIDIASLKNNNDTNNPVAFFLVKNIDDSLLLTYSDLGLEKYNVNLWDTSLNTTNLDTNTLHKNGWHNAYFEGVDSSFWTVSSKTIKYEHDGSIYEEDVKHNINEQKNILRSIKFGDNIWAAYNNSLYSFHLHQNLNNKRQYVIALTQFENKVFFITNNYELHSLDTNNNCSRKIGKITLGSIKEKPIKMIAVSPTKFYLAFPNNLFELGVYKSKIEATSRNNWKTENNEKDKNNKINAVSHCNNKVYLGSRNFLMCFDYTSNKFDKFTGIDTSDLYVVDIVDNGYNIYFATLNKGFYQIEKDTVITRFKNNKFESPRYSEIDFDYDFHSVSDIIYHNGKLLLNYADGIKRCNDDNRKPVPIHLSSPSDVQSILYYSTGQFFLLGDMGLMIGKITDSAINLNFRFTDLHFNKTNVTIVNNKAYFGTSEGLFVLNGERLENIKIAQSKTSQLFSPTSQYILIYILLLLLIFSFIYYIYRHKNNSKTFSERDLPKNYPVDEHVENLIKNLKEHFTEYENSIDKTNISLQIQADCKNLLNIMHGKKSLFERKNAKTEIFKYLLVLFLLRQSNQRYLSIIQQFKIEMDGKEVDTENLKIDSIRRKKDDFNQRCFPELFTTEDKNGTNKKNYLLREIYKALNA